MITIDELLVEYRRWSESYYVPSHIAVLEMVFGVLRRYYGSTPAAEFRPNRMRLLRERMILGEVDRDHEAERVAAARIARQCESKIAAILVDRDANRPLPTAEELVGL